MEVALHIEEKQFDKIMKLKNMKELDTNREERDLQQILQDVSIIYESTQTVK